MRPIFASRRNGFSLVELVLACALLVILLVAGRGAVSLASKSARSFSADQSVALSAALSEMTADLQGATSIFRVTATAIGINVPDRNGDDEDDSIVYSWSGTAGDPLVRTTNAGPPQTLVASMRSLSIATVQQTVTVPGQPLKNGERVVGGNQAASGLKNTTIKDNEWRAASFVASNLPASATSWNLTKVMIWVKQQSGIGGSFEVRVQGTNAQAPAGTVIAKATVNESDLSASYAPKTISFSNVQNLSVTSPVAIVVACTAASIDPCELQSTDSSSLMIAGNAYFKSTDGGNSWSQFNSEDLTYTVYGVPNTPTPTVSGTGVSFIRVTAESSPGVVMNINLPTPNIPAM